MKGSGELLSALSSLHGAIMAGIEDELGKAIASVAEDARSAAPVATGYMRDHITSGVSKKGEGVAAKAVSEAEYSGFVELGTHKQAAKPFLYPAGVGNEGQIRDAVATGVRRGLGVG